MRFKIITLSLVTTIIFSCKENNPNEKFIEILRSKIGNDLPFKDVKTAEIEGGTGIIVDGSWCYWVNSAGKIYCVNGTSKGIYNKNSEIECENAPIKSTFSEIEKIAK
jgi:hypothetical protein